MLDLGWQGMQSKIWIIIGALVCTVTIAIAQEPATSSPAEFDVEPSNLLLDEPIQDEARANSALTKTDEEIAREISAYESIEAQIFGDPDTYGELLPVDI